MLPLRNDEEMVKITVPPHENGARGLPVKPGRPRALVKGKFETLLMNVHYSRSNSSICSGTPAHQRTHQRTHQCTHKRTHQRTHRRTHQRPLELSRTGRHLHLQNCIWSQLSQSHRLTLHIFLLDSCASHLSVKQLRAPFHFGW